jgi:hypothetical protein
MGAHDVFISYSHEDKPVADAACAVLERHAVRCWIAPRDVTLGMSYGESIMDAIATARIMVLIFSDHANKSPQVEREIERAVSKGLWLIPIRIEDVVPRKSLEYFISTSHWLDALTPPMEQHLERLAEAVHNLLASLDKSPTPQPQGQVSGTGATISQSEPPSDATTDFERPRTEVPRMQEPDNQLTATTANRYPVEPASDASTAPPTTTAHKNDPPPKDQHQPPRRLSPKIMIGMAVTAVVLIVIGASLAIIVQQVHVRAVPRESSVVQNRYFPLAVVGYVCLGIAPLLIAAVLVVMIGRAIRRTATSAPVQRVATSAAHSIATRLTTALPKDDANRIRQPTSSRTATSTDDQPVRRES